jgi:hypothetical protein
MITQINSHNTNQLHLEDLGTGNEAQSCITVEQHIKITCLCHF